MMGPAANKNTDIMKRTMLPGNAMPYINAVLRITKTVDTMNTEDWEKAKYELKGTSGWCKKIGERRTYWKRQ